MDIHAVCHELLKWTLTGTTIAISACLFWRLKKAFNKEKTEKEVLAILTILFVFLLSMTLLITHNIKMIGFGFGDTKIEARTLILKDMPNN